MTKKTVFAAVAAFTDRVTKDGRILATPEGFMCPVKEFPLPVLWSPPDHHGAVVPTLSVGRVEQAYVVDHRLIVFGRLDDMDQAREVADMFREGSRVLEIDIDTGHETYDLDPTGDDLWFQAAPPEITFTSWRLRSAWVGSRPCWDLPPVQVEDVPG